MTVPTSYHHGDLPAALVRAAVEILEEGGAGDLSLRAAARRAGVSNAAPYRHFADRRALLSAVAAVGYRDLAIELAAVHPAPASADDLADVGIAYVQFALSRPGLFRVMFAEPCDPADEERTSAAETINAYVESIVARVFPDAEPEPMAVAVWALVHGLAFLYLDGKFDSGTPGDVDERVRAAVHAVLSATPRT
ncbi:MULTISPECIES: TetR/AcrR family transcriptional regulator [Gordonia]|uniref:TetR/AcrR family transcriptional regulator n=1 Tax=Gordonia sp. QH-12 TaxID=1437876 RepID=UPI0018CC9186|nr:MULTISPECIES: TetR/AcrR family transcriptional regulator [Gordonia]